MHQHLVLLPGKCACLLDDDCFVGHTDKAYRWHAG